MSGSESYGMSMRSGSIVALQIMSKSKCLMILKSADGYCRVTSCTRLISLLDWGKLQLPISGTGTLKQTSDLYADLIGLHSKAIRI